AAFAADKEVLTPSEVLMQEVSIIGSKFNIKNIAGSAAYLDVQDIREHNVADVNRLLRRVPGVNVRQEDGFGLFPNISLRGVDSARSSKVTIMEDGVLTAPAPYSAPSAYYSPSTARMSGVEVIKGSSQVKYGPHTTGGAINFLSTPVPTTEKYYTKSSFGTFNEVRSHSYFGQTNQTDLGDFGYLIEYYSRSNTGFKALDTNPASMRNEHEANTGFDKQEPMIKMFWEPKSDMYQKFEFKMGYTNLDANETYTGITNTDFQQHPNRRYAGTRFDEIESTHFRTYLRHFAEIDKNTNLVTTAYGNTFARNWQKLNKVGGNNISKAFFTSDLNILKGEAAGDLQVKNNARTYYTYGIESNLIHKMDVGETKHKLDIGVRVHYDQIRRLQNRTNYTQDADGNITSESTNELGSEGNQLQSTYATSLNVSDAIQYKKLTFTPGIRLEYLNSKFLKYGTDVDGKPCFGCTDHQAARDYMILVGGGSLKYDMYDDGNKDIDLFSSIHRGFSPPDPSGATGKGIREESSIGTEIGARYKNAKSAFAAEAVIFHTMIDDLIVNSSVGGAGGDATQNAGKVRTQGIELQVNYDPGLAKNWSFQMPMYVAATYTDATFREDVSSTDEESIFIGAKKGNELPYIAKEVLSFGLGYIYKKFSANIDANYTGAVWADGSNQGNEVNPETGTQDARFGKVEDQFVVDATLGWRFNKNVRTFSSFKNLFNEEYMVSRQPLGPRPGMPFAMMAGLEFNF
ncbi:TonB-dependent receptor, partial [Nitrospinae bacterium]|nr:TonB-dependent receptor [Nitrospinota bacterium]